MSLYKPKGIDVWYVNISHPGIDRIRRSTGETDRAAAQRKHDEIKASLWSAPKLKGKTWGMAVELWCSKETRSDSELLSLAKFGRRYKDRAITEVTRDSITAALGFCKSAGTFNRYAGMLAAILNAAQAEGWLVSAPKLARRTEKKKKTRVWLTHDQWNALVGQLPQHQLHMATFAIESGLRQANVLQLRWAQVDLVRKLVWIEADEMKGDKAVAIPLSRRALEVLKGQVGQHPEFVFTYRGKPISEIKTAFQAACVRAGLGQYDSDGKYTGFTWHGLRHTWATWHVQNETPLDVLMKLGGWSDLRMVMNYAHHSPGYLANYADNTKHDNASVNCTPLPEQPADSTADLQIRRP